MLVYHHVELKIIWSNCYGNFIGQWQYTSAISRLGRIYGPMPIKSLFKTNPKRLMAIAFDETSRVVMFIPPFVHVMNTFILVALNVDSSEHNPYKMSLFLVLFLV